MFLLPAPPQLLYQAPPGAQQLALLDLRKVPHFGHATALATVEVAGGVRTISSRSVNGRRVTYRRVGWVVDGGRPGVHTVADIDPGESKNMYVLLAFELIQIAPQSF